MGYTPHPGRNSMLAIKYMEWLNSKYGYHLEHSFNGAEKRIYLPDGTSYMVDGFDRQRGVIVEVLG